MRAIDPALRGVAQQNPDRLSRRGFLKAAGGAGLGLMVPLGLGGIAGRAQAADALMPNAFVRITPDNLVTIFIKHHEMGQGTTTGLATILAEELDADWAQIRAEYAPSNPKLYSNLYLGPVQGTGGSTAMANSWDQMRRAGATARAMLVSAAAESWKVPAAEIQVASGVLSHASGKKASFGELCEAAAELPVPAEVSLKDPASFKLVGKQKLGRLDSVAKSNGTATYTLDVKLPGLLTAVIARPPRFGATVQSFDASEALQVPGVKHVVQVNEGVAVVAEGFWAARQGREALKVQWNESRAETGGSAQWFAEYKTLAEKPGLPAKLSGDAPKALASAAKTIEASYEFPFLAHATMEPMDCVAWLHDGRLETWTGHQLQTVDHANAAAAAGLAQDKVVLHSLVSGGSFGRRALGTSDYVVEAVHVAKALASRPGGAVPVKVVRTREDDMRAGHYRPLFVHRVRAGLDASGKPLALEDTIVGQSILIGTLFEPMLVKDGIDGSSVEGVADTPYPFTNMAVTLHTPKTQVPVLWWRSVGHTHTAFVMETLVDEMAGLAEADPVAYRLELLKDHPRHVATLKLVAEKSGWGQKPPAGRAYGLAIHESFGTVVAQVAEVSLEGGLPRVHRVVCAVNCGIAINPDVIRAQMEGGVGYALSAAVNSALDIENGAVKQANFDSYPQLRINQMPVVEVHVVPSEAAPTGVGEPGVPPLAPAVANALAVLTGVRARSLPFARQEWVAV